MQWQRALVTGASSGIGEAFARELASRGSDLVLVARRKERLNEIADELTERHGVEVEVLAADLTDRDQLRRVEDRVADEGEPIDLLVNNAGGGTPGPGPFHSHDRDLVENQMILNAVSVLRLTHAALGLMTARGRGSVVQVSAGVAFYPVPLGATYAASKAFVNSLSQAADYELDGSGVHITTVCPGFTRTEAPLRNGFTEKNIPSWLWTDPEVVVKEALAGADRGEALISPTWVNKVNARIGSHFPSVMLRAAGRLRPLRKKAGGDDLPATSSGARGAGRT